MSISDTCPFGDNVPGKNIPSYQPWARKEVWIKTVFLKQTEKHDEGQIMLKDMSKNKHVARVKKHDEQNMFLVQSVIIQRNEVAI